MSKVQKKIDISDSIFATFGSNLKVVMLWAVCATDKGDRDDVCIATISPKCFEKIANRMGYVKDEH